MSNDLLELALDRMDRARAILTDNNPRPECNWGMLDTSDLRAALEAAQSQPWPQSNPWAFAVDQAMVNMALDCTVETSDPDACVDLLVRHCIDVGRLAAQPVGVPAGMQSDERLELIQRLRDARLSINMRHEWKDLMQEAADMLAAAPSLPVLPLDEKVQEFTDCETCGQRVTGPCNSVDCSIPDAPSAKVELPVVAYENRLAEIMPLFVEARDALPAISMAQAHLYGISMSLGDRMDAVGTKDWRAIAAQGAKK